MIEVGIGLTCPKGHERVQIAIDGSTCSVCGAEMIPDTDAPPVGLNRQCRACSTVTSVELYDTGACPQCGRPWS
jgi:hypothetical protein